MSFILPGFLTLGVLVCWDEVAAMSDDERVAAMRAAFPEGIPEAALFKVKGETGPVFAELARVVAMAAHQPGGIRLMGLHWCSDWGPHPRDDRYASRDFKAAS